MTTHEKKPEQVEVDSYSKSEPSENPISKALNVTVSVPEAIEIKMVDASVLSDYEIWFFITSLLGSALVGFFVAYLQGSGASFGYMSLVLGVIFIIAIFMTFNKRNKLGKKSKTVKLRATEIITKD